VRNPGNASVKRTALSERVRDETGFGHGRKTFRSMVNSMNVRPVDLLCRTAVYVTRMDGGVGGGSRETSPYPE